MNNTSYQVNGYQPDTNGPPVQIAAVIVGLFVIFWTIFANTIIIVCFFINRKKIWPCFSVQILNLCVSDMFVASASLPLAVFPLIDIEVTSLTCALIFYLFVTSQCNSLYSIFGICIHRCIVIGNVSTLDRNKPNFLAPKLLIILAWIVSFVLCFLATIIFGKSLSEKKDCVIDEIYENGFFGFLFVIYFVPQILTNFLYVVACVRLKCSFSKVLPIQQSQNEPRPSEAQPVPTDVAANRSKFRIQKKVLGTIGLIMLIFNMCTIPEVVLIIYGNKSRNVRYILSTLFILNSALNPFVYASRTTWLRLSLKSMFKDFARNILKLCVAR